ncbi:EamA family transporter [Rhizobium sp. CFBP 8762]|uniref:EamA family transporter n=1 Tax=Rhizobium sp. CFBP 8762 TaxID=2775279 RepID=UPI0017854C09|nr:EamA family transporter [Rhizobium sp. CFBP 8762]MBD8553375.1 EamA family transporter [Rhizobium sp. CFBP 8762]
MTNRKMDTALAAIAPIIWGSTYIITTQFLPTGYPITVAMIRALPAGLLLLIMVRRLPQGVWWLRSLALGALNFSIFWILLFVAAYRLPGGVAATLGSVQPLIVLLLGRLAGTARLQPMAFLSAFAGIAGVGLILAAPRMVLDPVGIAAAFGGTLSMAGGTVLARYWKAPVPPLTLTAWQMTAGGMLLLPVALALEPPFPIPTLPQIAALAYLGLVGGGLTYVLWFRGVIRLTPIAVSSLGFLSPVSATMLGWIFLGQSLTAVQLGGMAIIFLSIALAQLNS